MYLCLIFLFLAIYNLLLHTQFALYFNILFLAFALESILGHFYSLQDFIVKGFHFRRILNYFINSFVDEGLRILSL